MDPATLSTEVRPSPHETDGLALFTVNPLHTGDIAALISDPCKTSFSNAADSAKLLGLPIDSFICDMTGGNSYKAYYDADWLLPSEKPTSGTASTTPTRPSPTCA